METHRIQISEPWDYKHPNCTNSFGVAAVGIMDGPDLPNWQKHLLLLNVIEPFDFEGEPVTQILCTPRYKGVAMFSAKHLTCTVGISRVRPGFTLMSGQQVNPDQIHYIAIGEIAAHNKLLQRIKKSFAFFIR